MNVYILIDDENRRKASVMTHLTAAHGLSIKKVLFTNGSINTCIVHTVSPQEDNNGEGFSPTQFIVQTARFMGRSSLQIDCLLLLCLKLNANVLNGQPAAIDYINAMIGIGWNIMPVVVFDAPLPDKLNGISITSFVNTPSNKIASQVRQYWNIV
jgi:hypothetical protein